MRENLRPGPRIISGAADELLINHEPWTGLAPCSQTDPEIFFPEKGGSVKEAKAICATCEVIEQCLHYALINDERYGVFGGKSERERRAMKPRKCHECGNPVLGKAIRYCSTECSAAGARRVRSEIERRRKARAI
ncbi:WhiB family transcriptional regulator [Mycobacteroides abscessus]|uniref:WhiB family transcriptional regulator n=1 Tax=Mycobacteroides abscessus TaxID=36809 RepID=UPI0009281A85|nr:WhiB family transcriptional regulator [Mycobacteroides abscessus]QSM05147.1 WhiB family transcription factor [Mycobacterium phage prophiGD102-1]MDO3044165.1 WhiB family transcriptional regulator [Mycobacteroides abscessus subsp. abscessus]MDO3096777.1 WhiB family transcriptional regulator [Mycobacteroides abscessus subsp. abscessus]MDO3135625.1 WhiB family transcriptional regulator [Mycobacteroides abscessus subsp. abscessus]MDO3151083.1 WhiB family transcriptional regulator [Mycobacteroide